MHRLRLFEWKKFLALVSKDVDEKSYDTERCTFTGGGENPGVGCSGVDNGESCGVVADGSDGVKHEIDVKASERRWKSGFRWTSRNTFDVAFVANVALDGCGFCNVWEIGDYTFL